MPATTRTLSAAEARRIALAAQGFGERRPRARVDRGQVLGVAERLGLLQIDSVNVLVRAHELPVFARLGPYPRSAIRDLAERRRELFEYWGHAACLMPMTSRPLWRWRMDRLRERDRRGVERIERERPGYVAAVLAEVAERGPLTAGQLTDGGRASGPWWGWAHGKQVLEWLFSVGDLSVAGRTNAFERRYDLTERIIPPEVLGAPAPSIDEAHRELVRRVAGALGVATRRDLATYLYLGTARTATAIRELVGAGELEQVDVEGWSGPAWVRPDVRIPRRVDARALVAPFDPLVFDRDRVERLFGMRYRIELYTPAPKRVFGYYVLPFVLGDTLVGRIDLKADRARSTLVVQAAFAEDGADRRAAAAALADELRLMADWLELERIEVGRAGDLAESLRRVIGPAAGPPGAIAPGDGPRR